MSTFDKPDVTPGAPDNRGQTERLREIFQLILESGAAADAESAFKIVEDAFTKVEANRWGSMSPLKFGNMYPIYVPGGILRIRIHVKHVLYIGYNGSIDVRPLDRTKITPDSIYNDPQQLFKFPTECRKAGLDTRNVENLFY